MQIAVLGMGRMGQAVAGRLLEQGVDVSVWNRSPGRTAEAVAAGARDAGSVEEAVAGADVTYSSLADDAAVRAVASQVRTAIDGGIYVEGSTISPRLGGELAAEFDRFAAMPVLGSPDVVRAGAATFLLGGPPDVVADLGPLWSALSSNHLVYASASHAYTAKLTVNLLLLDGIVALAESVAVGRSGGLTDDQLRELLAGSPMVAPGMRNRLEAVVSGGGSTWWSITLGAKDAGLAVALAGDAGAELPVTELVRRRYQEAARRGFQDDDIATVAALYRQ
jgi:3-hydroxyisobutyrate dehydrogenase-like beta-hydroxyacid dehydrogenase